ncbi:ABC transporter ATP-binding protein [Melaminivora alkalimesophila]|uniref:Amino acid/amide ABC transporter ATP-binding protein 2 (HAAT family) n=1 Tax=Melaminivora alkalimesophila TaxID=1165852 RepID=A0A317R8E3_9BURK|nr:ABC transporter ATP-binding protein [Melaminivora alkalimesophila]PWW44358.1 amino acid/amide ABC transporter ATP-binding protein 2 (HAAT family) [Melaminivora alkalimesophila]
MSLLEIQGLAASYGKAVALESVSLQVQPGELVGVLGPNGAGKTTLLKAISRTLPSQGTLAFQGQSLHGREAHEVVGLGICHCPEGRRLFPELTVRKNLELGAYLRPSRAEVEADMEKVFALFPILRERLEQVVSTLSGGQQQFVAIGRALMGRPRLLLLDEPSVGIAHRLKIEIFDAIRAIAASGVAVLMAEQDAQNTLRVAERVYVLENGRVARQGSSAELAGDDHIRRIYLGV